MITLKEGGLYRLLYVRQSGNGRWYRCTAQAVFIGSQEGMYQQLLLFSFRPRMGTSSIKRNHLLGAELVKMVGARDTKHAEIALTRQLKGAVRPPTAADVLPIRIVKHGEET